MSKSNDGRIWPYAIVISILLIVAASIATIVVAVKHPVEMDDMDMQNYHHYDNNANEIIAAQIAFNRKYDVIHQHIVLTKDNAVVSYKITTKDGMNVDNANVHIMVTRPGNHNSDLPFAKPSDISDGVYTFEIGDLPLEGRWNIMAEITVNDDTRYYNLKADTRNSNVFEY